MNHKKISERRALAIVRTVFESEDVVMLIFSPREVYEIISALQLVCRHPGVSEHIKDDLGALAFNMVPALADNFPGIEEIIMAGFDPREDVDIDGNKIDETPHAG